MIRGIGRRTTSVVGEAREFGGFLGVNVDTSEIDMAIEKNLAMARAFADLPAVIAGRYRGRPKLLEMLKQLTPKDMRGDGEGRRPGGHMADDWQEIITPARVTTDPPTPSTVSIFNTGEKASRRILLFLEKGTKSSGYIITGKPLLIFRYKDRWWRKHKVKHPGLKGRFFIKKVRDEAEWRAEDYIKKIRTAAQQTWGRG